MSPQNEIIDEEVDEELLTRLLFRDLTEAKVDVRSPCAHCEGRGVKNGDTCPVCDGDQFVIQKMSLYTMGRKMAPLIFHELQKLKK